MVSQFFERAIAEIRRYGGSAEQFRGDAIMAMFGLQQAHEDDPERAVRAAFAVLNALAELAPQPPIGTGSPCRPGSGSNPAKW